MEKCFIANEESKYNRDWKKYLHMVDKQRKFVNNFLKQKGINSQSYMVRGGGFVNIPFEESNKKDISLYIEPTKENLEQFSKQLCKPDKYNMCKFKQSSRINKEFAQLCIDNKVIINLYQPRVGDYIESLYRYGIDQFPYDDKLYFKINSESLTEETNVPEDWQEIKCSEFYITKEKYEQQKKENK
ncbi:hypothetical protein ACFHWD_04325 [Clostridium sp. MT-14]|uniref:hypothetical protein n=1 Tax=Clostridium sp. MT-14 TaxID=3348360 RepID=UPI0035F21EB3